jgi:ADP-ribosyl-[dinitrogen reductase] hydrolase
MPPTPLARYRGCLLGLAAGDAVGTTLEFQPPGSFEPIADMVGGGPFRLAPGQWTDDTSMALCLADSLIACNGFDPTHQLDTYCRWWRAGYLSSTGWCFDIGRTTRAALESFERYEKEYPGLTEPRSAGNGCIMRLAPVPMLYAGDPGKAVEYAALSSRTTHGVVECVDTCRYLAGLIVGALQGRPKEELLAPLFTPAPGLWEKDPLAPKVAAVAAGSFQLKDPPAIRGTGYVVNSLEAALWAFHKADNFRDAVLLAVNLGDDADTTGAVVGQLAGAYYGEDAIPEGWRAKLAMRPLIEERAGQLFAMAARGSPTC